MWWWSSVGDLQVLGEVIALQDLGHLRPSFILNEQQELVIPRTKDIHYRDHFPPASGSRPDSRSRRETGKVVRHEAL